MKKKIVIFSRFNSDVGLSNWFKVDSKSQEWIEHRIKIFNKYTRVSFENQTNQDFLAVLTCLPESMPIIEEVLKKYPPLPANIIFTPEKNKEIEAYIKDVDYAYIAHIDSDDMYSLDFVERLQAYEPKPYTGVLICQQGYAYNEADGRMAYYFNKSPAVFTEIFKVTDYMGIYKYYPTIGHATVIYAGHEIVEGRSFITTVHGDNTWQQFGPQYRNWIINDEEEVIGVLKDFKLIKD